jgi:putative protease
MERIWKKPELMSPAGYWPQLKTAIEAGGDAVYFGLKHFTARAKVGFGLAELPEVMQTLYARGVKGFVTFNTLVFDHEFLEAEEALAAIAEAGADAIIVQDVGIAQLARRIYLELYGLKPSVARVEAAGIRCRVASPRILKPTEHNILHFLSSLDCEILVRSGGLLYDLQRVPQAQRPALTGDFSLNAANAITAQMYLDMGLTAITPTHDLNAQQIADLTHHLAADTIEIIVYQHLPVFHTEHCVFCRFLSTGTDYTNCGHPCEAHRVALQDKAGRMHPVMADVGCRNTVFGAEAQVGTKHLQLWLDAGIRHFRLEFVHESAQQVRQVVGAFQKALVGEMPCEHLERTLKQLAPQGITKGSLFVPLDYSRVPQLG